MSGALRLQEEDSSYESDNDVLDWTMTPTTQIFKDGFARCFIATPQPSNGSRCHPLYLVREMEIVPGKLRTDAAAEKQQPCLEIRVKEEDFRKCGSDLKQLSKHALPKMTPKAGDKSNSSKKHCHKSSTLSRGSSSGSMHLPDPSKSNVKESSIGLGRPFPRFGSAERAQQLPDTSLGRPLQLSRGSGALHTAFGADGRPSTAPENFKKPRPSWKGKASSLEVYCQAVNRRFSRTTANSAGLAQSASLPTLLCGR